MRASDFDTVFGKLEKNAISTLQFEVNTETDATSNVELLASALQVNTSLHALRIVADPFQQDFTIGSRGAQHLAEALSVNKTLQILILENNNIGPVGARHLAEALKVNNSLVELYLEGNNIQATGMRFLAEALKVNKSLQKLNLYSNQIGSAGAHHMAEALKVNKSIHTLDLMLNEIGRTGAFHLAEALKVNGTLQFLNLGGEYQRGNTIDSVGARYIASALKINKSLRLLKLDGNRIGSDGTQFLAEALKDNQSLQTLNLQQNEIDSAGAQFLAEAFKVNTSVHAVDLQQNEIGPTGAQHLAEALKDNQSLHTLDLGGNRIGSTGAQHLAEALKVNDSLRSMNLWENSIDFRGEQHLAESLKVNTTLHELRMGASGLVMMGCAKPSTENAHDSKLALAAIQNYLKRNQNMCTSREKDHERSDPSTSLLEQAEQLVTELKALIQQKVSTERKKENITLHFQQVLKEDIIPPFDKTKLQSQLQDMELQVRQMNGRVQQIYEGLKELNQREQLCEAEKLLHAENGANESEDTISRFQQKLMRHGKWIQRDLHQDYHDFEEAARNGNVLEATNLHGEKVILKKMSLSKEYLIRAAWNEISLLLKLQGRPNIIELNGAFLQSDYGSDPTHIVMEMPLYGTGNLMHWLKDVSSFSTESYDGRQLRSVPFSSSHDPESILRLLLRIIESVGELHNLGIEHRDLKPENILVDAYGQHKLIDFGGSKDEALSFVTTLPTRDSGAFDPGTFTRYYAPPEKRNAVTGQDRSKEFGKWDVYSLGVIMYECLCSPKDWDRIETLCETQEEAKRILTLSGKFSGWIQNLVWRMLDRDASSRPSIYEVANKMEQKILDNYSELSKRLRPKMQSAGEKLVESLHSSCRKHAGSNIYVRREHIVEDVISAFSQLNSREALLKEIGFRFRGEDESGYGSGVFREVCEALYTHLFAATDSAPNSSQDPVQQQPLFVKDLNHDFFSPLDDSDLSREMRAIGRFLLHCMSRNTPLRLLLSPVVYCEMTKFEPEKLNGWLEVFRRFDSATISSVDSYLHDTDSDKRQMAVDMIEEKKKALYGDNHRRRNIQHLCEGFTEYMTELEKERVELLNWDDMEMFCCGPQVISQRTLRRTMSRSLKDPQWKENEQTIRTLSWFKKWLREQDNDGLRLFLRFVTAQTSLPVELAGWKLRVLPCAAGIRAQTCSKEMYIGVNCESEELFFRMMQFAMENPGKLSD